MAKLIDCASCGAKIASDANTCPKCNHVTAKAKADAANEAKRDYAKCRTCGEAVSISEVSTGSWASSILNGNSSGSWVISIKACPHCGSTKPISQARARQYYNGPVFEKLVVGCLLPIGIAAAILIAIVLFSALSGW